MDYFKIRNKDTGLFSSGGHPPRFKAYGKIWPIGQLKAHLRLIQKYHKSFDVYSNCELICFTEVIGPAIIVLQDLLDPLEKELVIMKLKGLK